jgi:hypothetical protein
MLAIRGTVSEPHRGEAVRPATVLESGAVRLRALSEAECYTRCYGGKPGERISVVRILTAAERREVNARRRARIVRQERAA